MVYNSNILNRNVFSNKPSQYLSFELGLKINIWPFLIHFMQPNVSLIKNLMMHIDFLGKILYPVGRAKLSSTSVVILLRVYIPLIFKDWPFHFQLEF